MLWPAKRKEATQRPRSQSRQRKAQPSPRKDGTRSFKTQGMLFGDLCPVEYDEKLDPPVKACFNCWSFEHQRKYCTRPETYNYCCNCGRKGLTVEECPRCARAFHALGSGKKNWIYDNFFNTGANEGYGKKQTTPTKKSQVDKYWNDYYDEQETTQKMENRGKEYWDHYSESNCQSPSVDSYVKNASTRSRFNELKDEDFIFEPLKSYHSLETAYAEPYILFDYMRHKKIIDEWENEQINNAVNLNETRMAEMDSLDGNSIVSIEDSSKKDEGLLHLTDNPLQDLLRLLNAVKHLSVNTQDVIVMQYMDERKQLLAAKETVKVLKSM